MNVLSAIGLMKDQAYHLARHIWNDVHDDWPFYTDQERQILKRYDVAIKVKVIFFLTLKLCTPYYLLRGVTRKEKEKKPVFVVAIRTWQTAAIWASLARPVFVSIATPCYVHEGSLLMCRFFFFK